MIIGTKLEEILTEIEKRQDFVSKELRACPPGTLLKINERGKIVYYHDACIDGRRRRTSLNKQPKMLALLARKKYLETEAAILENNRQLLWKAVNGFYDATPEQILKQLPEKYRKLPKSLFFQTAEKGEDEADWWKNEPYRQSDYKPERKTHLTSRGLTVRSKSEVLIAEKLYEYQVPFRYEQVLTIGKYDLSPDFTLKSRSEELFYWEHCGLPGNKEYMQHHKWKLEVYESVGIVPWKNLIVTYDDPDGYINLAIIESEIRNKLL